MLGKLSTTELHTHCWLSLQQKTRKGFIRRWYMNRDRQGWKAYLFSGTVSRERLMQNPREQNQSLGLRASKSAVRPERSQEGSRD